MLRCHVFLFFQFKISSPQLHTIQLTSSIVLILCVSLCSKIVPRCHPGYPPASSLELSGLTRLNIEAAIYCQSFFSFVEKRNTHTKNNSNRLWKFPLWDNAWQLVWSHNFIYVSLLVCVCVLIWSMLVHGTWVLTVCLLSITWRPLEELFTSRKPFKNIT